MVLRHEIGGTLAKTRQINKKPTFIRLLFFTQQKSATSSPAQRHGGISRLVTLAWRRRARGRHSCLFHRARRSGGGAGSGPVGAVPFRQPATSPRLLLRSFFLDPPTHPVKNVSKGLLRLTLGGTRQSNGLVSATSFRSSTLYLTLLECQLLAFGFGLLRVAFSWSRGIYFYDEGLPLEHASK